MSFVALEMNHVYKKFKKGEIYDSLRDLIPALTGKLLRGKRDNGFEEREFWAVRDITFELEHGQAFGIIGPNGAGKSTILKLLSGIMKPTRGSLKVNGRLSALIEVGAGFHPDLTGRENIFLNGAILGMTKQEIRSKFDEIVAFSGVADFIDTPVKRYSSGMYARLGFSIAVHVEPDILIVDEVLSVGDYTFQRKCLEKMNSIINAGATVIFVSHNLKAVSDLCHRSVLLDHGKMVTLGSTDDVIRSYLEQINENRAGSRGHETFVSKVVTRNEAGDSVKFKSGEAAWVDIEVRANVRCDNFAIVLDIKDKSFYDIFNISTERLGHGTFSLDADQTLHCTFKLNLHLASEPFYLGVTLYRSENQKIYDRWFPATTIYVTADNDVRGVVNLYPRVTLADIESR